MGKKGEKRERHPNSLANLMPPFTAENQPTPEAKSRGQLIKHQHKDMCKMLFERLYKLGAFDLVTKKSIEQAENGELKALLELIKIIRPNDNQQTQIINAMQNVQKIYVTKKDEKNVNKHIDEIIGG